MDDEGRGERALEARDEKAAGAQWSGLRTAAQKSAAAWSTRRLLVKPPAPHRQTIQRWRKEGGMM